MPHKYRTDKALNELKDELATCEASIYRIQQIARGDREGFEALKAQIKDFLETAGSKKDNALDMLEVDSKGIQYPSEMQQKIAWLCRGQEKAFKIILDMVENSNQAISYYEAQKEIIRADIDKIKGMDVRND
jgi:hypothetical protein